MSDSPIEASADDLPWAHDGWRVQRKEGLGLSLVLTYRYHGEPLYGPKRIWHSETKTARDYGDMVREALLWEAIANYLDAGGTAAGLARAALLADEFPQISLPGYFLLDTSRDADGVIHTFVSEKDPSKLLSWQEDVIFEGLTHDQMVDYFQRCASDLSDDQEDLFDSSGAFPEEQDLLGP